MTSFLTTRRLILRNLSSDDIDTLFDYRNHPACAKYQHWENTSREYLQDWIQTFHTSSFLSEEMEQHYAICLHNNRMIGDLTCFYNSKDECFTIGYTISYQYQRQGYAFEMLSAVVACLLEHFPKTEIVGLVEKENIASIELLKKLGFIEETYSDKINSYIFVKKANSFKENI